MAMDICVLKENNFLTDFFDDEFSLIVLYLIETVPRFLSSNTLLDDSCMARVIILA